MSTLGQVMNTAMRSIMANQYALSVSSNNIANANNPDFSRQRLIMRPAGPDGSPWGIGMGVDVVGVQALRDDLLEARYRHALSSKFGLQTQAGRLSEMETAFNDSDGTGLLKSITDFFNSFQILSQDPASPTFREQVKTTARLLIEGFHAKDRELRDMKAAADKAIGFGVEEVNRLTSEIASITRQIKIEEAGRRADNLRDRRIALVKELSQYIEVNELDSGDYQVTTKDNRLLVMNVGSIPITAADITATIGSGLLHAELEIRDVYVPKYAAGLDQLAYEITQQVNSIHSAAFDSDGNTGVDFFNPLAAATDAARLISLSADVAGNSRRIAASNLAVGNDNGAAIALGNLLYDQVFSGGSVTDQYGALVFSVGSDVATSQSGLDEQSAILVQLENRRQSMSGVSIEEETLQMQQFQRAYEASAQLIKVVDELLQVTLGIVGTR